MIGWFRSRLGGERLEKRQQYSDQLLALAEAHVAGRAGNGDVMLTSAAEAVAGLYGRALSSAGVSPSGTRTSALTSSVLDLIGRELVRRGEALFHLTMSNGLPRLQPASGWTVHGGPDPDSWTFSVQLSGPDSSDTVMLSAAEVLLFTVGSAPESPWRGRSPLSRASMSSSLAGWMEARVRDEVSAQVGRVIPVPDTTATGGVQENLAAMGGKTLLVPDSTTGWPDGTVGTPRSSWHPVRVGADPPDALVALRMDAQRAVWTACGVPHELCEAGEGTGAREALRRFLHLTLSPIARMVEEECSAKLETDVKLDFESLYATDMTGRARALNSLVQSGVSPKAASEAAGFRFEDDDIRTPPAPQATPKESA